jgi:hypothetical protein
MRNYPMRLSAALYVLQCLFAFALYGCAEPAAQESKSGANANTVECLIPGQIRQLDDKTTFPTQRQVIHVTREECRARGGEQSPP